MIETEAATRSAVVVVEKFGRSHSVTVASLRFFVISSSTIRFAKLAKSAENRAPNNLFHNQRLLAMKIEKLVT